MTATSPIVIAEEGHTSAQAPHATQSASLTDGILVTSINTIKCEYLLGFIDESAVYTED
jgi:hypothetical protein